MNNNNYIAKGCSVILVLALIFLIGYGTYRDKMMNEKAMQAIAERKAAKEVAEIKNKEALAKEVLAKKILEEKKSKYKNKNWMAIGDEITLKEEYQNHVKKICGFANSNQNLSTTLPSFGMTSGELDYKSSWDAGS